MKKIVIGISSCLLGNEVRFDGGHKRSRYVTDSLGCYFEYQAFCPEVAIGLGIPRPPIQLFEDDGITRVRGVREPDRDFTDDLRRYGQEVATQLDHLCGYIFKKGSPSCGMERVKRYRQNGIPEPDGIGAFADEIMHARPEMPVEEEGRLMDPSLRENFVERVFVMQRWLALKESGLDANSLVNFHRRHKFILQAHDEVAYRELGRMTGDAGTRNLDELAEQYIKLMMAALKKVATPKTHTNVLTHIFGFFKEHLSREDKAELLELIDEYRLKRVPLIVPITLLKHYLRIYPNDYIAEQYYMNPHPSELMLRNHI